MIRFKFRPLPFAAAGIAVSSVFAYAYSAPYFSEILSNTENDAALEYFTLRNPACVPLSLSGYSVVDASWKAYTFASWASVGALSSASFFRPETKITLNNENETLSLFDPFAVRLDFYSYPTSTKGAALVRTGFSDDVCQVSVPADSGSAALPPVTVPEAPLPVTDVPVVETHPPETSATQESAPEQVPETPAPPEMPPVPDESSVSSQDGVSAADSPSGDSGSADAVLENAPSDPNPIASASDAGGVSELSAETAVPPASEWTGLPPAAPGSALSVSRAMAERLELVDANGDGRFDFADVRYSENLSGTADPAEFFLYSNTGGLYAARVATATGFFSTATISWSVLRLWFSGTTLVKTSFRIDSSTSSEFRIKNLSAASLRTASSWLPTFPLALTTSFSGYSSDRISFSPAFPEPETDAPSGVSGLSNGNAAAPIATVSSGNSVIPAVAILSGPSSTNSGTTAKAKTPKVPKPAKKVQTSSGYSSEPMPDPDGFSVVPSSWIDLMPSWKYRYVCYSSSCPVSFKAEGVPPKSRSYWLFSDGRKRFGTSTSTLWKTVPASYRLAFVIETAEWTSKTPVEVSVVTENPLKSDVSVASKAQTGSKTTASAKKAVKSVASSSSASASKKSSSKAVESKAKAPVLKSSTGGLDETGPGYSDKSGYRTVSVALASVFLWLSAWTGWFAYRRRSWLPEETP